MQGCEKIQDWMLAYFDGTLDAEQARALNLHLETCAQCRSLFEGMEALMEAEKTLPKDTPTGLHEQIMCAVRWDARLARLRARSRRHAWIAAACACLILLGAGSLSLLRMGAAKSDGSENGMAYYADTAAPESNESVTQDSAFDNGNSNADGTDGSDPEEDGGMIPSDAGGDGWDEMKSEQKDLPEATLDAILTSLQIEAADVNTLVCDAQDLAALEAASGVQAVEVEGYQTLLLDAETFDALLAQGLFSNADSYYPDRGHAAQVLVISRA